PPTTEIYSLSLHDALPISRPDRNRRRAFRRAGRVARDLRAQDRQAARLDRLEPAGRRARAIRARDEPVAARADDRSGRARARGRSEEHTSELQSLTNLVCP